MIIFLYQIYFRQINVVAHFGIKSKTDPSKSISSEHVQPAVKNKSSIEAVVLFSYTSIGWKRIPTEIDQLWLSVKVISVQYSTFKKNIQICTLFINQNPPSQVAQYFGEEVVSRQ